jgi:preprotein translocase subunit SecG
MGLLIGLLTVLLVLNSVVLIFLVLIQLPKREAGLGLAFGGSAADALFGAGSGTVLTKATKYAATIFLVLCVVLGVLQSSYYHKSKKAFEEQVQGQTQPVPLPLAPGTPPQPAQPATGTPIAPTPTPAGSPAQQPPEATAPGATAPAQPSVGTAITPQPAPAPSDQTRPAPAQQGQSQ